MTAAYRLKGVGWLGTCVAVVLGFYLVSLQVAAERKKLDGMNARIASAQRDIRALQTEFETRANLAQLEKWNGDTLALSAPTAGQFVRDEAALASYDVSGTTGAQVQTAALVVPSIASAPAVVPAAAVQTASVPASQPLRTAPVKPAAIQLAAITAPTPRRPATVVATPVRAAASIKPVEGALVRTAAAVVKVRPQAVAMLDRKLLSENTLGDILSGARREARLR